MITFIRKKLNKSDGRTNKDIIQRFYYRRNCYRNHHNKFEVAGTIINERLDGNMDQPRFEKSFAQKKIY